MNSFMKSSVFFFSALVIFVMFTGCTPGKAQTRGNDHAGSFEREDYEAFDREDPGDDEIPAYKEDRKSDSSDKYARNDKKYREKSYKVKSDSGEDVEEDYSSGDRKYNSDTKGVSDDDTDYDSDSGKDTAKDERYYQKGYASWYGREFHGKTTASGEKFDMNLYTAAHKTLPFGTIVEVKNLDNGKSVRIKVNDRGPYRGNRIIDLSYGAAKEIDMIRKGEVKVGIKVIKMGDNSTVSNEDANDKKYFEPVSDDEVYRDENLDRNKKSRDDDYNSDEYDNLKLQAGAFYSRRNAEQLKDKIQDITDRKVKVVKDGEYYKVRIEGIKNKREQDRIRNTLKSEDISSFSVD